MNVVATGAGQLVEVQGTGEGGVFSARAARGDDRARAARHRASSSRRQAEAIARGARAERSARRGARGRHRQRAASCARSAHCSPTCRSCCASLRDFPSVALPDGGRRLPRERAGQGAQRRRGRRVCRRSRTTRGSRWRASAARRDRAPRATADPGSTTPVASQHLLRALRGRTETRARGALRLRRGAARCRTATACTRARRVPGAHPRRAARQRRLRLRPGVLVERAACRRWPSCPRRARTQISHRGRALRALRRDRGAAARASRAGQADRG